MNKKRILIVSSSFYPENSPRSFRTTELAKEFARQGHNVKILTPKREEFHREFEKKHNLKIKDLGMRRWNRISVRGKGLGRLFRRSAARISSLLIEYPDLELYWMVKRALREESGYDLLVSIAVPYPVHWGVASSRSISTPIAGTWVADCGDPYMGQENDSFRKPFYFAFVEKWFMRKADYISVPTRGAMEAYYREFRPKIRIIPQGFRFEDYRFEGIETENLKPTFAYAGNFIPGRRDPAEFIEFLNQLDDEFVFHIYTRTPHMVRGVNGSKDKKVFIHDPVPREELLRLLGKMDFLVNFENVGTRQTPSKIIDYLILGKPVLSVKTGHLDKQLVREFLSGNYERSVVIDNPEQYRIENVCKNFIQLTE